MKVRQLISQLTWVRDNEFRIVAWSMIYFFCLLSGYFLLRPLRDEMGIRNGAANMQWLFTATFLTMLLVVPLFGYLTQRFRLRPFLVYTYVFFIGNLLIFYALFRWKQELSFLPLVYFVWLSVFNLFVISLFWSFMADIYSKEASERLFGIIALGGSIGAIVGPLITLKTVDKIGATGLLLLAAILLSVALFAMRKIIVLKSSTFTENGTFNESPIAIQRTWFEGILTVANSRFLIHISLFVFLYTFVSTILYFEQAAILENTMQDTHPRITYFSHVNLATNILAIIGQFALTNRAIRLLGLARVFTMVPIFLIFGFLVLAWRSDLYLLAIVLIVHRAANYTLLRPGREMLFTVTTRTVRYRAKNFMDTAVYRGGDALTAWFFASLSSLGAEGSLIILISLPVLWFWSRTGYAMGRLYNTKRDKLENIWENQE